MIRRAYRNWRLGVYVTRATEASVLVGKAVIEGAREGQRMRAAGLPEPPFPEWECPAFEAKASRRRRQTNLAAMRRHALAWGRAAGWRFSRTALETSAEEMVREAEEYANRGHAS